MKELCMRCGEETPCRVVHHPSGTEWVCDVCGSQVDFMINDELDDEWSDYQYDT